jgi:hypothetical protein
MCESVCEEYCLLVCAAMRLEVYRRFGGTYFFNFYRKVGASMFLVNTGKLLPDDATSHRRQYSFNNNRYTVNIF